MGIMMIVMNPRAEHAQLWPAVSTSYSRRERWNEMVQNGEVVSELDLHYRPTLER